MRAHAHAHAKFVLQPKEQVCLMNVCIVCIQTYVYTSINGLLFHIYSDVFILICMQVCFMNVCIVCIQNMCAHVHKWCTGPHDLRCSYWYVCMYASWMYVLHVYKDMWMNGLLVHHIRPIVYIWVHNFMYASMTHACMYPNCHACMYTNLLVHVDTIVDNSETAACHHVA